MTTETPLVGGNTSTGIVRVGDTVRRAPRPNAVAIRALLAHLDARAPGIAPRHLGTDERGREIVTWIEGWCGVAPWLWREDPPLVGAARLLRRLHDAGAGFDADAHDWPAALDAPGPGEVLCHHDTAPYNMVFRDHVPIALIDFDLAGPGPAIRDVAYAVYWFAPLAFAAHDMHGYADAELAAGLPRTRRFCVEYGIAADARLIATIAGRLSALADLARMRELFGDATANHLREAGHLAHWRAEADAFERMRPRLLAALDRADSDA